MWALWRLLLAATFTVLTPYNVAPQHHNLPHSTLPAKNPIFSNTWSFLLMMGIKMPETCRESSQLSTSGIDNKSYILLHLVGILSSRAVSSLLKDKSINCVEELVAGNSENYTKCAHTVIRCNSWSTETQLFKYLVLLSNYVVLCYTLYYGSSKFTLFVFYNLRLSA